MASDVPLRILFSRLSRAFNTFVATTTSAAGASAVPYYDTVADMLAADVIEIQSFARCHNYTGTDGIESLWMRAANAVLDNASDIRQSTFHPAIFYERIWSKENTL